MRSELGRFLEGMSVIAIVVVITAGLHFGSEMIQNHPTFKQGDCITPKRKEELEDWEIPPYRTVYRINRVGKTGYKVTARKQNDPDEFVESKIKYPFDRTNFEKVSCDEL